MTIDLPEPRCSLELLARRLSGSIALSVREQELLLRQTRFVTGYEPGSSVRMPTNPDLRPTVIASGWACRESITPGGRRQLLSILLPGDVIWCGGDECPIDLLETVAITRLKVVNLASALRAMDPDPATFASLLRGLKLLQREEEHELVEHAIRLGLRADQRIAGLILHLFDRCRRIGFVTGRSFVMPLRQACFGNLAGLSKIHVNRVLRQLKAEGTIRWSRGIVEILDRRSLASIAEGSRQGETWHERRYNDVPECAAAGA